MPNPRNDRMRANLLQQGGRPQLRTTPEPPADDEMAGGPGKRADERIISLPVDEILPDRYQGRLRWAIDLEELERFYSGAWDAQDLLSAIHDARTTHGNSALEEAWQAIVDLAHSILADGQVAPITVYPSRDLPTGYRYLIETGEGRYWAYQVVRWLAANDPTALRIPQNEWKEDPHYIRAVAISSPSRLRQVAENEQRQSYPSAVDRAIAYASMLAEDAGIEVQGSPPGIRNGQLELPDAYRRAASRGLRGRQHVVQQLPASTRQIQRHLQLLTDLDAVVLARAKSESVEESKLRRLLNKPPEEQRQLIETIISEKLSSRSVDELVEQGDAEPFVEELTIGSPLAPLEKGEMSLDEEVERLLRTLTKATSHYEKLRERLTDTQLAAYLEVQLRSYDEVARGSKRATTPRRRIQRLKQFLTKVGE
jgi:ParB-like chromosome segregation protein Spo0J